MFHGWMQACSISRKNSYRYKRLNTWYILFVHIHTHARLSSLFKYGLFFPHVQKLKLYVHNVMYMYSCTTRTKHSVQVKPSSRISLQERIPSLPGYNRTLNRHCQPIIHVDAQYYNNCHDHQMKILYDVHVHVYEKTKGLPTHFSLIH